MPIINHRPCWSRYVEFDTSIAGTTWHMLAMAMTDLLDVIANPRLMSDLELRCRANLNGLRGGSFGSISGTSNVQPWRYTDEPVDKWSAFSVLADRFPGQSVVADCDDLVGPWGAFWKSRSWDTDRGRWMTDAKKKSARVPLGVGVAISQPKLRPCCVGEGCGDRARKKCGHGMAHTYDVLLMPDDFRPAFDFGGALVSGEALRQHAASAVGDLWIWDGSVAAGMDRPSPSFYGSGETSLLWMPDVELSHLEV